MSQTTNTSSINLAQMDKLDELARQAENAPAAWPFYENSFRKAATPSAVRALIELARRSLTSGAPAEPKLLGQVLMYPNYSTVIQWVDGVTPPAGTKLYAAPVHDAAAPTCPACQGNDKNMPCAYPSKGMQGCLRDERLSAGAAAPSAEQAPDDALDAIDPNVFFDALSDYDDSPMSVSDRQAFFDTLNKRILSAGAAAKTEQAPVDDLRVKDALRAVCLNARAVIRRWESPLWRQEVGTNDFINQLRNAVDTADLTVLPVIGAAGAGSAQPIDAGQDIEASGERQSIGEDADFLDCIADVYNAGAFNESIEKSQNRIIAYIDGRTAGTRGVGSDGAAGTVEKDAARYRWLRNGANFHGPKILKHYGDEELDRKIDAAMEAHNKAGKEQG